MLTKLTLGEKLKDLRHAKGYKNTEDLAKAVNIPKTTLNNYEDDEKNQDVGYANLIILAKFYEVSMDYLLGLSDVSRHLDTGHTNLGLTDDVIDLLKNQKINTRLLCEIILHEHFTDFMANLEIYIDGLASSQINTLNSMLRISREEIKTQHNPDDKEIYIHTLAQGQIQEDRYFHGIIHEDIDCMADDIRKTHMTNKKDTLVASSDLSAEIDFAKVINEIVNYKGNADEKQTFFIFSMLGIDIRKLKPKEKESLIKVVQKSKHFWKKK